MHKTQELHSKGDVPFSFRVFFVFCDEGKQWATTVMDRCNCTLRQATQQNFFVLSENGKNLGNKKGEQAVVSIGSTGGRASADLLTSVLAFSSARLLIFSSTFARTWVSRTSLSLVLGKASAPGNEHAGASSSFFFFCFFFFLSKHAGQLYALWCSLFCLELKRPQI